MKKKKQWEVKGLVYVNGYVDYPHSCRFQGMSLFYRWYFEFTTSAKADSTFDMWFVITNTKDDFIEISKVNAFSCRSMNDKAAVIDEGFIYDVFLSQEEANEFYNTMNSLYSMDLTGGKLIT